MSLSGQHEHRRHHRRGGISDPHTHAGGGLEFAVGHGLTKRAARGWWSGPGDRPALAGPLDTGPGGAVPTSPGEHRSGPQVVLTCQHQVGAGSVRGSSIS